MEYKNKPLPRNDLWIILLLSSASVTLLLTCLVLQNVIVKIEFGYVCGTIFVYPFVCMILDIIAEVYGYYISRQVLFFTIVSTIIFSLFVFYISLLPNPEFGFIYAHEFRVATSHLVRNSLVGGISILIGQITNIFILTKFKQILQGKYFALRSILATFFGDTITFIIALLGFFIHTQIVDTHELFVITIDELIIIYFAAFVLSIPGSVVVWLLKNKANLNNNIEVVHINPFKSKDSSLK